MLTRPRDREVVCHASAWDMDDKDDVRIKMCMKPIEEDLFTVYHELGHVYYYIWYKDQPMLFQDGAHDGFHEAIGDAINLSVTPAYLRKIGLVGDVMPSKEAVINQQMKMALDKIAFLPFGKLIDEWRWGVFDGRIKPADYNKAWWELREKYQGVSRAGARAPKRTSIRARSTTSRATRRTRVISCRSSCSSSSTRRCAMRRASRVRSTSARSSAAPRPARSTARCSRRARASRGRTRCEELTGTREMDASAIIDYFKPLEGVARGTEQGPVLRLGLRGS